MVIPSWMLDIQNSVEGDMMVAELISQLSVDKQGSSLYNYSSGILIKRGKIIVGTHGELRHQLISIFHDFPVSGHSGQ